MNEWAEVRSAGTCLRPRVVARVHEYSSTRVQGLKAEVEKLESQLAGVAQAPPLHSRTGPHARACMHACARAHRWRPPAHVHSVDVVSGRGSSQPWEQCSAAQRSAVQRSAVQGSAVQRSTVQCSAVQCGRSGGAAQRSAVRCSAAHCSAVQCSARAAQRSAAWTAPPLRLCRLAIADRRSGNGSSSEVPGGCH